VIPSEQKVWVPYIIFDKESELYHGTFSIFVNKDLGIYWKISENQRMSAEWNIYGNTWNLENLETKIQDSPGTNPIRDVRMWVIIYLSNKLYFNKIFACMRIFFLLIWRKMRLFKGFDGYISCWNLKRWWF
jgi:hypothetical protein